MRNILLSTILVFCSVTLCGEGLDLPEERADYIDKWVQKNLESPKDREIIAERLRQGSLKDFSENKKINNRIKFLIRIKLPALKEIAPYIAELDLSNTSLQNIPSTLSSFRNLVFLDLSHNKLNDLPQKFIEKFPFLATLRLEGNVFRRNFKAPVLSPIIEAQIADEVLAPKPHPALRYFIDVEEALADIQRNVSEAPVKLSSLFSCHDPYHAASQFDVFSQNIHQLKPRLLHDDYTNPLRRVVFDLDSTLCWHIPDQNLAVVRIRYPSLYIVPLSIDGKIFHFAIAPDLKYLFDYLLEKKVVIVFFSAAGVRRNVPLINALGEAFYGKQAYEDLVEKGQFQIFSNRHLITFGDYKFKDLHVVVNDVSELPNTIIVEDDPCYVPLDQRPCLPCARSENPFTLFDGQFEDEHQKLSREHVPYMIGVLDACFKITTENPRLSLQEALKAVMGDHDLTYKNYESCYNLSSYPRYDLLETQNFIAKGHQIISEMWMR